MPADPFKLLDCSDPLNVVIINQSRDLSVWTRGGPCVRTFFG